MVQQFSHAPEGLPGIAVCSYTANRNSKRVNSKANKQGDEKCENEPSCRSFCGSGRATPHRQLANGAVVEDAGFFCLRLLFSVAER